MSTQIPRVPDPTLLPGQSRGTGQVLHPALGPVTTNDITAEQDAIKRDVNDPEIRRLMDRKTGRQMPSPAASAAEFQPSAARVVGDLVTGPDPQGRFQLPKANPPGDLVTGAEVPTARRPMITDWPSDQEQTTVNNAPEPGQGSELR